MIDEQTDILSPRSTTSTVQPIHTNNTPTQDTDNRLLDNNYDTTSVNGATDNQYIDKHLVNGDSSDTEHIELTTIDIHGSNMGNTSSATTYEKEHLLTNGHHRSHIDIVEEELLFEELRDASKVSTTQYLIYAITPLILTVLSLCILVFTYVVPLSGPELNINVCDILCTGPIISILQHSNLYITDTKTLVDKPLRSAPEVVWRKFWDLTDLKLDTIEKFIDDNFDNYGVEVLHWLPDDYSDSGPLFIDSISDPVMAQWTYDIHTLWNVLGRELSDKVYEHPERYTSITLKNKHMMVPGGRFREFYYWDSYWIVRGLLSSNMVSTAQMVVENLLDLVDRFGFVPNGSRLYYLNRSQPPFLTQMVDAVYSVTQNKTFLYYAVYCQCPVLVYYLYVLVVQLMLCYEVIVYQFVHQSLFNYMVMQWQCANTSTSLLYTC